EVVHREAVHEALQIEQLQGREDGEEHAHVGMHERVHRNVAKAEPRRNCERRQARYGDQREQRPVVGERLAARRLSDVNTGMGHAVYIGALLSRANAPEIRPGMWARESARARLCSPRHLRRDAAPASGTCPWRTLRGLPTGIGCKSECPTPE